MIREGSEPAEPPPMREFRLVCYVCGVRWTLKYACLPCAEKLAAGEVPSCHNCGADDVVATEQK
jgi:hypothetical protein